GISMMVVSSSTSDTGFPRVHRGWGASDSAASVVSSRSRRRLTHRWVCEEQSRSMSSSMSIPSPPSIEGAAGSFSRVWLQPTGAGCGSSSSLVLLGRLMKSRSSAPTGGRRMDPDGAHDRADEPVLLIERGLARALRWLEPRSELRELVDVVREPGDAG